MNTQSPLEQPSSAKSQKSYQIMQGKLFSLSLFPSFPCSDLNLGQNYEKYFFPSWRLYNRPEFIDFLKETNIQMNNNTDNKQS